MKSGYVKCWCHSCVLDIRLVAQGALPSPDCTSRNATETELPATDMESSHGGNGSDGDYCTNSVVNVMLTQSEGAHRLALRSQNVS